MAKKTRAGQDTTESPAAGDTAAEDIVVFAITGHAVCRECGTKLVKGEFLRSEDKQPYCLSCADLDHLVFLPRGDMALTRRARKHSALSAVVVKFSKARRRFERQGLLVAEAALEQAERECLADEAARLRARERAAVRRSELDERYVCEFAEQLGKLFPGCPVAERQAIADHACLKYSGRVGRSAAAKQLDREAIEFAVKAHVRHCHTSYDQMLTRGVSRDNARSRVRDAVKEVLERWQQPGLPKSTA
jgi:hypothetical protein